MSAYKFIDGDGNAKYREVGSGAGSSGDGYCDKVTHLGDGTNQFKSGSATNLAAQTAINGQIVCLPGDWTSSHRPTAASLQATTTKAAGAAGVRHIATGIFGTICGLSSAPTATFATLNLIDGTTAGATILASMTLGVPAVAGGCIPFSFSNLNIVGSAATAMTLETSAAQGANTIISVNLTGHDTV